MSEREETVQYALDVISGKAPVAPPDTETERKIRKKWDSIAKPLDSLGAFEMLHARIGAIQHREQPDLAHGAIFVLCADNGIVKEGVSQSPQEVTALCAKNIAAGKSCLTPLARRAGAAVEVFDVGMAGSTVPGVRNHRAGGGTRDFLREPAMTREEMLFAIGTGIHLVKEAKSLGFTILGTGEMGIGNTTTSAACLSALLSLPASQTAGRGAGLSDTGLMRKQEVIEEALLKYRFSPGDPERILQTVGGFDIAGLAGMYLGGALYGIPIVMDGLISQTAALFAARFRPEARACMIPSHRSRQPAAGHIMKELEFEPVLDAGMALGEGTGAALILELLQSADAVYREAGRFGGYGMDPYERY